MRGQTSEECQSMRPVAVTNNPSDEEFWQFRARLKNTLYWEPLGIPILFIPIGPPGRSVPRDINVIGSRETCEAVRARVTDPTESCKGPFYFHRGGK